MVVVSHLFSLFREKFSGGSDQIRSLPPLFWTIYFPTAPSIYKALILDKESEIPVVATYLIVMYLLPEAILKLL